MQVGNAVTIAYLYVYTELLYLGICVELEFEVLGHWQFRMCGINISGIVKERDVEYEHCSS
jgi:hypothetical protein